MDPQRTRARESAVAEADYGDAAAVVDLRQQRRQQQEPQISNEMAIKLAAAEECVEAWRLAGLSGVAAVVEELRRWRQGTRWGTE